MRVAAIVAEIEAMKRSLAELERRAIGDLPTLEIEPPLFVSPAVAADTDKSIERLYAQDVA